MNNENDQIDRVIAWNEDQIDHQIVVQKQVLEFCTKLQVSAIEHDRTKWTAKEYRQFLLSHDSLRQSKDGKDAEYQKHLKSEAIQHHIQSNPHHAEYWDKRDKPMPVHEIISMFFDWRSRSLAKGTDMADFWEYNMAKLKNQPHAQVIVDALRREYETDYDGFYTEFHSIDQNDIYGDRVSESGPL